ncbi:protein NO VEIN domain-containing protein [Sinorhizobium meliloti]|uniref:protein NO VEIN domain-containing protein n=1 Tax=Rhizobium meliloti TaxID=382 RepID=UPI00238026C0|nr:DUF3883 domain-containing protein [Sinorhizobium meliloti]MDE3819743.1 DUF3883 domain-containing protein [Sinorhizobium meliloti]
MHDQIRHEHGNAARDCKDGPNTVEGTKRPAVTIPYRANLLGNIEQALKGLQGYGIMALELIQNADDAGSKRLLFDVRDDALVVANDEEFTSCGLNDAECPWIRAGDASGLQRPCNFHAISEMGSRSKLHAAEQIGRFGIGFVSVYQITDTPIVRSAGVELRLNPQTQEVVKSDVGPTVGTQFILPWASSKSEVREGLNASPTPDDVADKVVAEIDLVLKGSLLFLRHVEHVELRHNSDLVVSVDIGRSGDEVILRFWPYDVSQHWLILSRQADDVVADKKLFERFEALTRLERSLTVNVAVPIHSEQVDGLLYAYLPTRQPTRMPIHVNADFFPHASRQAIVLEGEQHERYWNEALIETAAAALSENFVRIRDLLGPMRLWALAESAFQRKAEPAFKSFWDRLARAAVEAPSIWTTRGEWRVPNETFLPPEVMTTVDQAAVTDLGLALIHPELRRHWSVLGSIGAHQLRLSSLVAALEARGDDATGGGGEPLRRLWSAISVMIEASSERNVLITVLPKLKAICFIMDDDDAPISPSDARKLPLGAPRDILHKVIPTRRIVHPHVLQVPHLAELVPEYLLDDLASDLAKVIVDEAAAEAAIGLTDADVRRFYSLLTSFPTDRKTGTVAGVLADVPILRTGTGFVSPSRGQLPGDFRDPIGHFQIVESRLFVPDMRELARNVLEVDVLNFRDYVSEHLEEIIEAGVTRQQYGALITEIVNHRSQLDEDGTLGMLTNIAFVRTRAGTFALPAEVYIWSAALESILGTDPDRWVDETWIPAAVQAKSRDLFDRLGMPFTVAAEHIVDRIEAIAEAGGGIDAIVAGTTPIIRHVLDRWARFNDRDRNTLRRLKEVKFLSAVIDAERSEGLRYSPRGVYRAGRAPGFLSQVPVVEMTALRQTSAAVLEFLDLIEMPAEPPTEKIVAHLEHCISRGSAVNDLTYQMLNERLERGDDVSCIDRLEGTEFIHFPDVGFIGAGEVFWNPPEFGGHWHTASSRMRQREQLYRRLGVVDSPEPHHFAALALQIAANPNPSATDTAIHGRCIAFLAEALEREDAGASDAVDMLVDEHAFLNVDGGAIWTGEAVWLDSEQLAASFGSVLNERLIRLPDVSRSASFRFLKRLDVPALTDIAQFRMATEPEGRPAPDATSLLQSRADLLLWLAPNRASRQALRASLLGIEIRLSNQLLVQAEIDAFNPPVRSPATSTPAYLDQETGLLHLRSTTGRVDWAAAFRALFSRVERFCPAADVPPLCMTAAYIMSHVDRADAEQALIASDFKVPDDVDVSIEVGRELKDEPEDLPSNGETKEAEAAGSKDDDASEEFSCGQEVPEDDPVAGGTGAAEYHPENLRPTSRLANHGKTGAGSSHARGASQLAEQSRTDEGAADAPRTADGEDDPLSVDSDGDAYESASSRGAFGAHPDEHGTASEKAGRANAHRGGTSNGENRGLGSRFKGDDSRRRDVTAERQVRRSRMLSYVSRSGSRGNGDDGATSVSDDLSDLIDAASMKAVLSYEQSRGWEPERQPHFNPGFDIVSRSPSGDSRLIEVKGLDDEWTERGIKLSHVQFSMAREHPDEFWIYIVEHARNLERQRVTAIRNPFGKVEEYWFDHNWRQASEEGASSREIHLKVGLKVEHHIWREGVIVEIKSRGAIPFVVVDFGSIEGRRGIPFNSSLKILD